MHGCENWMFQYFGVYRACFVSLRSKLIRIWIDYNRNTFDHLNVLFIWIWIKLFLCDYSVSRWFDDVVTSCRYNIRFTVVMATKLLFKFMMLSININILQTTWAIFISCQHWTYLSAQWSLCRMPRNRWKNSGFRTVL